MSVKSVHVSLFAVLAMIVVSPTTALAESGAPAEEALSSAQSNESAATAKMVVKEIFQRASEPEIAGDSAKQAVVNTKIDFAAMAKNALGREYSKRSAEERKWFQDTLQEIITRTVYPSAPKFLKSVKIAYKKVKQDGKNATVSSIVRSKGERTRVEYDLRQGEDGTWRVVDVAFDGESWVDNIREQVYRTVRKRNWTGLEKRMNRRLANLRSGKGANRSRAKQAKAKPSKVSDS